MTGSCLSANYMNRIINIAFLIVTGLFILPVPCNCQEFSFREYGVREGLPQSEARILCQDSRGFLWIATRNGLSRFDGIDFENYHVKDGLPDNKVVHVFEDSEQKLWVLNRQGVSLYTGDRFQYFPRNSDLAKYSFSGNPYPGVKPSSAYFLGKDLRNGKDSRIRIVYFEDGKYSDFSSRFSGLDTLQVDDFCYINSSEELLILFKNQLFLWKNQHLKRLPLNDVKKIDGRGGVVTVLSGDKRLAYKNERFIFHLNHEAARHGIARLHDNNKLIVSYLDSSRNLVIPLQFKATDAFTDREGTVWLSSESNIYRLLSPAFRQWSHEEMKMSTPWGICPDRKGNLWIGSLFGDLRYFNGSEFIEEDSFRKVLGNNSVFYKGSRLMSNGQSWISANTNILIFDDGRFSVLKELQGTQICYIYEDTDNGLVMVGTDKGLYTIRGREISLNPHFIDSELGVIEGITKDDNGAYWFSGHNGLVKMEDTAITKINEYLLPEVFTYTMEKDRSGGLWVSSESGLYFKSKNTDTFRLALPESVNQPANAVKVLNDNYILAGRITDICLIDLDKFYSGADTYYRLYDRTDGYPGTEVLDNGIVRGSDEKIWILTSENLVEFNQALLWKNTMPPKLNITGFFFETDSQTWQPVNKGELYYGIPSEIVLRRNQHRIRITFNGISSSNPDKVKYSYMIGESDLKWSTPSERREVVIRNLRSGTYNFRLKAINADGFETIEPLNFKFTIQKAFGETAIFYLLLVAGIIIATILLTKYLIRKNNRIREEKQKLRSELLRLQMSNFLSEFDPHFTFNAISSVGSLIMKNDRQSAYLYLTRLSSLLRASLRDSTTMLKTISEELDFVRNYCELQKLRFGNRFDYHIRVGEDVDLNKQIPKMTIQTFVENGIKHGIENKKSGGAVEVVILHIKGYHKFLIRDNGVGRAAADKVKSASTGIGIRTVSRILEIINMYNKTESTLEIRDPDTDVFFSGTEVVITIPDNYSFSISETDLIDFDY